MSRVALANIKSLTFYKDAWTGSRRGQPISQLTCIGKHCNLYQPDAVRCTNVGGSGIDIDWKCEADLPEALRFGRVEVSCEGWDGPGDPYVLKGSCGLEYRLVLVPKNLRAGAPDSPRFPSRSYLHDKLKAATEDPISTAFILLWLVVLAIIVISWSGCLQSRRHTNNRPPAPRPPRQPGWFSGGGGTRPHDHNSDPPPPYSKNNAPDSRANATGSDGWRPGFWSGALLGALGTYLTNRRTQDQGQRQGHPRAAYDWETARSSVPASTPWWTRGASSSRQAYSSSNEDRGEGSSDLGAMRTSVGLGGSNVR